MAARGIAWGWCVVQRPPKQTDFKRGERHWYQRLTNSADRERVRVYAHDGPGFREFSPDEFEQGFKVEEKR